MTDVDDHHEHDGHDGHDDDHGGAFVALGIGADVAGELAVRGVRSPFAVQTLTIPDVLAGRDVSARAPTGSGKTLAFGLPVLERLRRGEPARAGAPRALVLAPTRELARQIGDELAPLARVAGRRAHVFQGGTRFEPQIDALAAGVDLAVGTPGRLLDLVRQDLLTLGDVEVAVVDEADRLADMGFLPQVRELLDLTSADRQTLLFSATLDGDVAELVERYQRLPVTREVAPPELVTMRHLMWLVHDAARPALLAALVRRTGSTVVFSRTRHGADRIATRLERAHIRTTVLHGGNSQRIRDEALDRFRRGEVDALVTTDVVARGIHVDEVACVVQYDLPADPKDYVHRAGRTARAGATGTVVSFVSPFAIDHARRLAEAAGVEVEFGEPDLELLEPVEQRAAVDAELAALAALKRPGAVGGVRWSSRTR